MIATSRFSRRSTARYTLAIAPWPWLFGINGPIGLVTFLIAVKALPETGTSQRRLNYVGAGLHAATFICLVSGLQALAHDATRALALGQLAAACLLPLSQNPSVSLSLGTRHRAAIGMSEDSDAVVLVVSEEDGTISLARGGLLTRGLEPAGVLSTLRFESSSWPRFLTAPRRD